MAGLIFRGLALLLGFAIPLWPADALAQDLTTKELQTAKHIYDSKCVRCHRPYEPRDYPEEEWRLWMTKMSKKARLKPNQEKLLNRYLDAYRAEKPSAKTGNTPGANQSSAGPSEKKAGVGQ